MVHQSTLRCVELLTKALVPIPQELNEIDWKIGPSSRPEKYKKHLSAFANYPGGGFVVFGISDKDGSVVGITDSDSKTISSVISNMARDGVEPKVKTEFFSIEFSEKNLFVCQIFESIEKPVYELNNGKIVTPYIRAGGTSRPMDISEVRSVVFNSRQIRYEEVPAAFDFQDNWDKYFDFSEVKNRLKRTSFTSDEAFKEFLFNLKLVAKVNGQFVPTNLAVITCAKDFSIITGHERFEIRLVTYKGTNKIETINDISFSKGFSLCLDEVMASINRILPHSEIIHQATRFNVPIIPTIATREIIANAIVHRDYSKHNSRLMIEIYTDRIEVTNPGNLLPDIDIDRLIDHPSKARNEVLADFMRQLGFAEERGSGIDKAVLSCELAGLPPIKFVNGSDYFKAMLFAPRSYAQMDRNERIEAVYQHCCLNYVTSKKTTNRTIRERFKFGDQETTKSTRIIKEALESGKIKLANPDSIRKDYNYIPYWA